MRKFLCSLWLALAVSSAALAAPTPPNFVFILIDDMPWFGTPVRMDAELPESAMAFRNMPNVVQLAQQGMILRNARSAAGMCAPSRCSIMTGMMTAHHLYSGNGGFGPKTDGNVTYLTRAKEMTYPLLTPEPQGNIRFPSVGDVLQGAGYATAHFGKWHLYGGGPEKHGFQESDGETDNKDGKAEDPVTGQKTPLNEDPKKVFSITQRGNEFMERQVKAGKPFYLQLSHYATHALYQARQATFDKNSKNPVFKQIEKPAEQHNMIMAAALAEDLDTAIGQTLAKLEELGVAKNTYVIFTADNGYRIWNEKYDPLRGAKWWLWEDGVRVPMIVRGPGVAAGSRTKVNVVGYDFLPTIADLSGTSDRLAKEVDGASFKSVLLAEKLPAGFAERPLYFHYPHYRVSPPCSAIVTGDRKLLHFYEWPESRFVFDLTNDLAERHNVATADPAGVEIMETQLMTRLKEVGGYFPKPNPRADVKDKKTYDPNNLTDLGAEGDPEVTESQHPTDKTPRKGGKKQTEKK